MIFQRTVPCFEAVNSGFPLSSCCDFNSTTGPHIVSRLLHSSCESEYTHSLSGPSVCLLLSVSLSLTQTACLGIIHGFALEPLQSLLNNCKSKLILLFTVFMVGIFEMGVLIMAEINQVQFHFEVLVIVSC